MKQICLESQNIHQDQIDDPIDVFRRYYGEDALEAAIRWHLN